MTEPLHIKHPGDLPAPAGTKIIKLAILHPLLFNSASAITHRQSKPNHSRRHELRPARLNCRIQIRIEVKLNERGA